MIYLMILVLINKIEIGYFYYELSQTDVVRNTVTPIVLATTVLMEAILIWLVRTMTEDRLSRLSNY